MEEARAGSGGAMLLEGEAGTAHNGPLGQAAARAVGMRVVAVSGVEAEAGLPFAGLSAALAPFTGLIDALPAVQAAALRTALALGDSPVGAADPVATLQGTTSLLAAAADQAP